MSTEPDVPVPMPSRYGSPHCPSCGYRCGCCCHCNCQTPCDKPCDENGDPVEVPFDEEEHYCECRPACHGGHDPWDCNDWSTRYNWAKNKSERLANEQGT